MVDSAAAGADCAEWLANEISLPDLHLTYKLGWTLLQTSIFTQCKAKFYKLARAH